MQVLKAYKVDPFAKKETWFEVHYQETVDNGGDFVAAEDVTIVDTYRGKTMRSHSTAEKCLAKLQKEHPTAVGWEIAEYDEDGRVD